MNILNRQLRLVGLEAKQERRDGDGLDMCSGAKMGKQRRMLKVELPGKRRASGGGRGGLRIWLRKACRWSAEQRKMQRTERDGSRRSAMATTTGSSQQRRKKILLYSKN